MVKMSKSKSRKFTVLKKAALALLGLLLVNVVADKFYKRLDLTKEGRYTLSESTKKLLSKVNDNVYVTIFLDGDLPREYKRLKSATRDMLNEYRLESSNAVTFFVEQGRFGLSQVASDTPRHKRPFQGMRPVH